MSEKAYDLFVSYADADREWVEGFLLDALGAAGSRILTQKDFPLGSRWTEQFERAVEQSARVLLVVSSAYLGDLNQQFVDGLSAYHSLKADESSVIVLLLEEVPLRLGLDALVKLKAVTSADREAAVSRLCKDLGVERATSPPIRCPYPGMRTFLVSDKENFFGRRSECETIIHRLCLQPCIFLIGSSGSGKSSLAMAGVVPALPNSQLFGAANWQHEIIRPGERSGKDSTLAISKLKTDPVATVDATKESSRPSPKCVLIVDQYEETFTQLTPAERDSFESQLLKWVDEERGARYVVVTVRADFYSDLMLSPVWRRFGGNHFDVLPLSRDNLREAIVEPAQKCGVFIERTLIDHLLNDAIGEPGALSLLQETMRLIWEKHERRFLPHDSYRSLTHGAGRTGLQTALAAVADTALSKLSTSRIEIAMRIFLRLVQFGQGRPDTRRQQRRSRLRSQAEEEKSFEETLQHLVDSRLLVLGEAEMAGSSLAGDAPVDFAHEQLIISWPEFQHWLAARREAEVVRRRLEDKATEWIRLGGSGGLLDEIELREAEGWAADTRNSDLGVSKELGALIDASKNAILARQKAEEDARIARQKAEDDARLARQKAEDDARLARQKAEDAARLAKQKAEDDLRNAQENARKARHRLLRSVAIGAVGASVVLLGVSVFAVLQWNAAGVANTQLTDTVGKLKTSLTNETIARGQADTSKNIALAQGSRAMANLASSEGQRALEADPALAVALASRSLTLSPTNRARRLLFDAVRAVPVYNELRSAEGPKKKERISLFHSGSPLRHVRFAPSGRQVLIVRTNGTVSVWDPDTLQATSFAEAIHDVRDVVVAASANRASFLSNTKVLVYSFDENGTARLTRELSGKFLGGTLSKDGGTLVALEATRLVVVSLDSGKQIEVAVDQAPLGVAIAKNNSRCAVLMKDGQMAMFSLPDGSPLHRGKSEISLSSKSAIDFLLPQEKLLEAKDARQKAQRTANPEEIEKATRQFESAEKALQEAYQDALGLPVPALTISGYATQAIMALGSPEETEARDVTIEFTADDAGVFVAVANSSSLDVEVWNAALTDRAFHRRGLFSRADLRSDGEMMAIAGPSSIQTFAISPGQKLKITDRQHWSASMETERLGEPVSVAFSHHGDYVATVHSPALMLQGARSSSVSLWYAEEVDSRDDNTHRGHRLKPYSARIDSISFSSQDDRVLTTDVDGTVRVWKIVAGEKLFSDKSDSPLYVQYLFSGLSYVPDETVDLLRTQFKSDSELIAAARKICRRSLSPAEEKALGIIDLDSGAPLSLPKPEPLRYAWRPAAWYDAQAKVHAPLPDNEALTALIQDILKGDLKDEEVGRRYLEAVKRDILLLSGAQNRWAAGILADVNATGFAEAAIVMGLSGDRETVADLQKARSPSRTVTELKALDWAIAFLERQGRDLSLGGVAKLERIEALETIDLCCWPKCAEAELRLKDLDLSHATDELKQAASRHHAYDPKRSLASYAFALAVTGRDRGYLLKIIADFYEIEKDYRNARRFAEASRTVDGGNADVENLLGNLDDAEGKLDEAVVHYRRSLELGRIDGWPEHNLAKVFEKKQDLVAAEAHFRAALGRRDTVRRPAELAQFLNGAAWFLVTHFETDTSKVGEALRFSEEANEITKRKNANYLDTLALCKFTLGDVDEAIQIEEKALKLLKGDDDLRAELTQRLARFKEKRK